MNTIIKPTWKIHYVTEHDCELCSGVHNKIPYGYYKDDYFANIHTHGLSEYNHREICMCLDVGLEMVADILNSIGMRIANSGAQYSEGLYDNVLANGYNVEFISFDNDPTLYMMVPDKNNNLPSNPDCLEPYKSQVDYAKFISDNKEYV